MADETAYQALTRVRSELAAETARANAAEMKAYDAYLQAALNGLCVNYRFGTPAAEVLEQAERLTLAALRTRRRYYEGLSPNVPPQPSKKAEKNGTPTLENKR